MDDIVGQVFRRMPQEKRLETLSGLIHLGALSHGEALNPRASVGHETDESLGFQLSQGLSNRNPGAPITLGKLFLDDAFAGSVLAREDRPPKALGDSGARGTITCGGSQFSHSLFRRSRGIPHHNVTLGFVSLAVGVTNQFALHTPRREEIDPALACRALLAHHDIAQHLDTL